MRRMRVLLSSVLCLLLLTNCKVTEPNRQCGDLDDLRETVFRYQFEHNASAGQTQVGVFFVSLDDRIEPDADFIKRFIGHVPVVKPVAESEVIEGGLVADRATGERGIIFRIEDEHEEDGRILVTGGYYEGEVSASEKLYTVSCEGGAWAVSKAVMRWIS